MPIEFACSVCQTVLRTPDETAGKAARCPSCGNVQAIPGLGQVDSQIEKTGLPPVGSGLSPSLKQASPGNQDSLHDNPFKQPLQPTSNPYAAVAPSERPHYHYRPFDLHSAKSKLQPPAITLLVLNCLTLAITGLGLFGGFMELATGRAQTDDIVMLVVVSVMFVLILLGIVGCVCMLMMKNRPLAVIGSICSMVSGFYCCFIPAGFAIWALVAVLDSKVTPFFR